MLLNRSVYEPRFQCGGLEAMAKAWLGGCDGGGDGGGEVYKPQNTKTISYMRPRGLNAAYRALYGYSIGCLTDLIGILAFLPDFP